MTAGLVDVHPGKSLLGSGELLDFENGLVGIQCGSIISQILVAIADLGVDLFAIYEVRIQFQNFLVGLQSFIELAELEVMVRHALIQIGQVGILIADHLDGFLVVLDSLGVLSQLLVAAA